MSAAFGFSIRTLLVLVTIGLANTAVLAHKDPPEPPFKMPDLPDGMSPHGGVVQALEAVWLTEDERAALRVNHGIWLDADLNTVERQAIIALNAWKFDDPSLQDERVPLEWRAEALSRTGQLAAALELLGDRPTMHAARIRAEVLEQLGRLEEANAAVDAPVQTLLRQRTDDAAVLTEGVRAMLVRSRVQGQPARDFVHMISLLSRAHQQLDRLSWQARLVEAQLLNDKHNAQDAYAAFMEVLALNPRCSEAWYGLGRMALRGFNFDGAAAAALQLRQQNPEHPLAALIDAELLLIQDDPEGALGHLQSLLVRYPKMRPALALVAAAQAIRYDTEARDAALARYDELSPGSAAAYYAAGRQLSLNRQYQMASDMFEEAIARQPNWPHPQIDLGLMHMQSGRDSRALHVLKDAVILDPFNKRAANSLLLIEDLINNYETIDTEHFIIRFQPGIDEVMTRLLPSYLEEMHEAITGRFAFEPDQKTVLEVMPDHKHFAVRITGMPGIFTIAACTGPVIAMEVPREGRSSLHRGLFDWPRVIRHEYTHTVTLAQTRNRIPHWLTEACAVTMEGGPRDFDRCRMLAAALAKDELFTLDEIKWGFVRPKRGTNERALAYAQSAWMLEFMDEAFGPQAVIDLMAQYRAGAREAEAIPAALEISRDAFMRDFKVWATAQVKQWGLLPDVTIADLQDEARRLEPELRALVEESQRARREFIVSMLTRQVGAPKRADGRSFDGEAWPPFIEPPVQMTPKRLERWLVAFPDQPDLWEIKLRSYFEANEPVTDEVVGWLEHYASIRPVDPFPHKRLAQHWLSSDEQHKAIEHLEYLDVREQYSPVYTKRLASMYRDNASYDLALAKALRVVEIDPYDAEARELVTQIALLRKDFAQARQHIVALTMLEPDRSIHLKRLERVDELLER